MSNGYAASLAEALPDLQRLQEEKTRQVLAPTLLNSYLSYKVDEWERYHQSVTDWEVKEYLRLY